MSEEESEPAVAKGLSKGERAAIVDGPKDVGVRGEVFWVGENKYGPGMRYGLRGDDGATYWVDAAHLGAEDGAPPAPETSKPAPSSGDTTASTLEKGDTIEIVTGRDAGKRGEIFWIGESKFGKGMRYGVRSADQESYWVDQAQVVRVEGVPEARSIRDGGAAPTPYDAPPPDDAPPPSDADFASFPDEDEVPF